MATRTSSVSLIHAANLAAIGKQTPTGASWADQHASQWRKATGRERVIRNGSNGANAQSRAIVDMVEAWAAYADAHFERYESVIGEDYVLGVAWVEMGKAIRTMLNGELGGLDGGTVDGMLLAIATNESANLE